MDEERKESLYDSSDSEEIETITDEDSEDEAQAKMVLIKPKTKKSPLAIFLLLIVNIIGAVILFAFGALFYATTFGNGIDKDILGYMHGGTYTVGNPSDTTDTPPQPKGFNHKYSFDEVSSNG